MLGGELRLLLESYILDRTTRLHHSIPMPLGLRLRSRYSGAPACASELSGGKIGLGARSSP